MGAWALSRPGYRVDLTRSLLTRIFIMPRVNPTNDLDIDSSGRVDDLLSRNWQTTTCVALTVGTGGLATGVMLGAFPVQTITTGLAIGGLGYVGHRRHTGQPLNPWQSDDTPVSVDATPEPTV